MEHLNKYTARATKRTPRILLERGKIIIRGRSIPEDAGELYRPVYEWIVNYTRMNGHQTSIELGFEYINTSSTKWIYSIIKEIAGIENLASNVKISWYYDRGDEDMCELGHILKSMVECPFYVIETEGMDRVPDEATVVNTI